MKTEGMEECSDTEGTRAATIKPELRKHNQ